MEGGGGGSLGLWWSSEVIKSGFIFGFCSNSKLLLTYNEKKLKRKCIHTYVTAVIARPG